MFSKEGLISLYRIGVGVIAQVSGAIDEGLITDDDEKMRACIKAKKASTIGDAAKNVAVSDFAATDDQIYR